MLVPLGQVRLSSPLEARTHTNIRDYGHTKAD